MNVYDSLGGEDQGFYDLFRYIRISDQVQGDIKSKRIWISRKECPHHHHEDHCAGLGLKELKWLQDVTKFPTPEYWQGIFAKIRTFEKEMNMTIDDIRETDLEPSLDALLNDAFKLADTIIERSCDEDSDNYQCGQRQYDSDKDSSNTMPLLTMEDIRSMSDMDTGDQSPEPSDPAHSPTRPGCGFPHGNNFCDSHRRQYEYEKAKQERARAKLTARNRYLRRTLRSE
ncbi:uncharacterized protein LOC127860851 [Dreissena polymorpha]|uniref:uncharacterized protein LOC127860851 n=1 Tax=Dreissena polymorpha TaxID=45954 RepID=UPI0022640C8A|nr:uncharacterized protein LOC127860851 [Dreissena polymorpha]